MANTSLSVISTAQAQQILDTHAGNIASQTWDAVANVLTITLLNDDTITINFVAGDVTTLSLAEYAFTLWPKKVEKDNSKTEMWSPLELFELKQKEEAAAGRGRRLVMRTRDVCERASYTGMRGAKSF